MYTIEVKSSFEQLWRYNTIIMCGGFSPDDELLYVVSTKDIISDMENPIESAPADFTLPRSVMLNADDAEHIRTIIYITPHTLPLGREVKENPPFDVDVTITKDLKNIYSSKHQVNQWGGASIEIKL
ncbi:MAG: hypothetical protein SNH35_04460 [Rikenellaceae bacterium]